MAKIVREAPASEFDEAYTRRLVEDYKNHKSMLEQTQKRADALKAELTEMLVAYGNPDEKGNIWIDLGDVELKRERRVSKSFNSSAAEAWAKENGYWDTVKEVVEVLSEDKLLGLAWNSEDIQEKVKTFYVEKETWALKA
jgi:Cu2+-containing amine oxidase